jgi:DNA-binding CsgD family transcriptional regulator
MEPGDPRWDSAMGGRFLGFGRLDVKCVSAIPQTLLDREQCLADLDRWAFTTAGGGCIALVHGEAGIGKTALVREFTRRCPQRRVLWGSCDDLYTPRVLAPLHDIASQSKGTLFEAINAGANRDVIFNVVLDDLEHGTPATFVFEDMQWADEATLDLLKFLGRRIARTRAILVITYRDDESGPRHPLRSVIGDLPREHIRHIALTALSEQSTAKLARRAGYPPSNLHALTGGNPWLVTESLACGAADIPVSIRDAVLARAIRLPAAAREIAEFVCLQPGETAIKLLQKVVDVGELPIESCQSIGVMRGEDNSLTFRHELLRRALYASLSETRRHTLHARELDVLKMDMDTPAAVLAHHADGCGNVGMVLHYAPIAAAEASSIGEHSKAAAHYRTALNNVSQLEPVRRAVLQEKLARECYLIDQIAAVQFGALTRSARVKLDRGDWEGCSDDVEAVLRNSNAPPAARVAALTLLVQIRARRGDPDTDSPLAEALALALQLRDLHCLCALGVARAEMAWLLEDREAVIRAIVPVYEPARRQPDPQVNGNLAVWLFRANALEGDATDFAEPYASEIAGKWRAAADAWEQHECPYERATVLALYGGEVEKREALAIFEVLAASPAARAIRKQFRAKGVKRIPRGVRPTTQSNQFGLTRREAEVLELLSKGLRNSAIARALFVSQKTVDHHVSSILSKLGVPSRGAAVVAVTGTGSREVIRPQSRAK